VTIRSQVSTLLANNKATRLQSFPIIVPQKFGLKKKDALPNRPSFSNNSGG
jgi:hypothetical protein